MPYLREHGLIIGTQASLSQTGESVPARCSKSWLSYVTVLYSCCMGTSVAFQVSIHTSMAGCSSDVSCLCVANAGRLRAYSHSFWELLLLAQLGIQSIWR